MSDTVKIDLENLDDLKDLLNDKRKVLRFDFQKIFSHLVLNWQWYLLSLLICLSCAYFTFVMHLGFKAVPISYLVGWIVMMAFEIPFLIKWYNKTDI